MNYLENFLIKCKKKAFYKNLKKYEKLSREKKLITIISFITHLLIDKDNGVANDEYIDDLVFIFNDFYLYGLDNFLFYLSKKIGGSSEDKINE